MLSSFRQHRHLPGARVRSGALMAVALAIVALGATAGAASAQQPVNIVSQGEPPSGKIPRNTHYFTTIQAAVNASGKGAWVLIEPGVYDEEVLVTSEHAGIHIRGMDRNTVIVDGQHKAGPEGANGIEVVKANNVWIENLTVRNFDSCRDRSIAERLSRRRSHEQAGDLRRDDAQDLAGAA